MDDKTFEDDDYEDAEETRYKLKTKKCGEINVYIQGNLHTITSVTPIMLTVHDIGTNHTEFHRLVEHPCMAKLKAKSVWIHFEIPGQEFDAPDLPESFNFPTMQEISDDIETILNYFDIRCCVAIGEGAGANIVARYAMHFPDRLYGIILIHCHPSVSNVMEYFNEKIVSWKLNTMGMNATAEQYLVFHKFGSLLEKAESKEKRFSLIKSYIQKLQERMNSKNLRLYVESYLNRSDISHVLREKIKVDTLLVSGSKSSHVLAGETMQSHMNPRLTTMVKIDDCADVFVDAPETFAYNLLLFCQGLGLFSALPISRNGSIS